MTAQLVTHTARVPLWMAPGVVYDQEAIAKMRSGHGQVPGQLWARLAENN